MPAGDEVELRPQSPRAAYPARWHCILLARFHQSRGSTDPLRQRPASTRGGGSRIAGDGDDAFKAGGKKLRLALSQRRVGRIILRPPNCARRLLPHFLNSQIARRNPTDAPIHFVPAELAAVVRRLSRLRSARAVVWSALVGGTPATSGADGRSLSTAGCRSRSRRRPPPGFSSPPLSITAASA